MSPIRMSPFVFLAAFGAVQPAGAASHEPDRLDRAPDTALSGDADEVVSLDIFVAAPRGVDPTSTFFQTRTPEEARVELVAALKHDPRFVGGEPRRIAFEALLRLPNADRSRGWLIDDQRTAELVLAVASDADAIRRAAVEATPRLAEAFRDEARDAVLAAVTNAECPHVFYAALDAAAPLGVVDDPAAIDTVERLLISPSSLPGVWQDPVAEPLSLAESREVDHEELSQQWKVAVWRGRQADGHAHAILNRAAGFLLDRIEWSDDGATDAWQAHLDDAADRLALADAEPLDVEYASVDAAIVDAMTQDLFLGPDSLYMTLSDQQRATWWHTFRQRGLEPHAAVYRVLNTTGYGSFYALLAVRPQDLAEVLRFIDDCPHKSTQYDIFRQHLIDVVNGGVDPTR